MTPHLRIMLFLVPLILLFAPYVLKRVQKALVHARMRNCSRSEPMNQVQSLESPDMHVIRSQLINSSQKWISVHDPVSCNSASTTFSTREGQTLDGSSPRLPLFTWRLAPSSWAESVPSTLTKTSTWKWLPWGEFTWIDSMIQLQFCCI